MIEGARRSARWRLAERGLPRPGDEDWRFTPLAAILGKSYTAARPAGLTEAELEGLCLAPLDGYRLVFDNGRLAAELSRLPQGLRCGGLADEIDEALLLGPEEAGFGALAAARFCDGPYVVIPKGMKLDAPLHVVTVATSAEEQPREAHYRGVVVLEPGAEAVIVEEAVGRGGGEFFTNSVTRCELAEGSRLELYRLMRETEPLVSVHGLRARLGRDAGLRSHVVGLGGALARCDADVVLAGEGCEAELNGLYLACRRQHLDFHTRVVHAVPRGRSRELYKGVLDGQARSVFDGLVEVLPGAQKTDAHVYNKNLLLSEGGLAHTKPEFKIHANDVQCRHGATVGQLSEDALFYLRSRGVGTAQARSLLVYAFASEMLGRMALTKVREALARRIEAASGLEGA